MTQDVRESLVAVCAVLTAFAIILVGVWGPDMLGFSIPSWVTNLLIACFVAVAYRVVRHVRKDKVDG